MRRGFIFLFVACISILLTGCSSEVNQNQPQVQTQTQTTKEDVKLIDPAIIESATITNDIGKETNYTMSSTDSKELIATLKKTDLINDEKSDDKLFINTLIFFDKNGNKIITIQTMDHERIQYYKNQLIVGDSLNQGKSYSSKPFYDKFEEIIIKNNYVLPDRVGG